MSARAWKARRGDEAARAEREESTPCRTIACLRNRKGGPRHLHFRPRVEQIPHWAYGTNRKGRRNARKRPPWGTA